MTILSRCAAFWSNRNANFGMMFAILSLPLVVTVGAGLDFSRQSSARAHLQDMVDATALSLATSKVRDEEALRVLANELLDANRRGGLLEQFEIASLLPTEENVELGVRGSIKASFMGIVGFDRLPVTASSLAERAVVGEVEVSLILDNTYSMSAKDAAGRTRLTVLKTAASGLVNELLKEPSAPVRIALVPYADYVNVGTHNRSQPWLSVAEDYSTTTTTTPPPQTCETRTTKTRCIRNNPTYACTKTVDGISVASTCGGGCAEQETYTVAPYQYCTGGGNTTTTTTNFKWHGCVNSRTGTGNRLHNNNVTTTKYVGRITRDTQFYCMAPIVELTNDRQTLLNAISGMVFERSGYQPQTYIPGGLIWGHATLDPAQPFTSASPFDVDRRKPRKVAILMTDGENTLKWNTNGQHGAATTAAHVTASNDDTAAICQNMKTAGIEIFTIAFMVENEVAKTLLRNCSNDPTTHYFDATRSEELLTAFSNIAGALRVVRIAR